MPGGVRMPLASAVIRLPDRTLAIYSPGPFDGDHVRAIELLGEVRHLIAPSLLHHLFVEEAIARWPAATVHAVPGLAAKVPALATARELVPFGGLEVELVGGAPRLGEAVVFHPESGSLVCADFLFNIVAPATFATRAVLALTGAGGGLRQSRLWRFAVRDRQAARASIDRILRWPIARVIPVHGEPCTIDAGALAPRLSRAYRGRVDTPR